MRRLSFSFFMVVLSGLAFGLFLRPAARALALASPITLSLSDAIAKALTHNLALKAQAQAVAMAKGERLSSFQAVLPTITGTGTYTRNLKQNVIFFPDTQTGQTQAIELGEDNSYDIGAQVTQPIFDFGGMYYALKGSGLAYKASQAAYANAKNDLIYQTTVSYYRLQYLMRNDEIARQAVVQAAETVSAVRAQEKQGLKSAYEVLDATVERETRAAEQVAAESLLSEQWRRFRTLLDLDGETPVHLIDALPTPQAPHGFDRLLDIALSKNPVLEQLHLSSESLKAAWKGAQRQWAPRLDGIFRYALQGESEALLPDSGDFAETMSAGMTLRVPVFDGLRREGDIQTAKARYMKSLYDLQNALREFVDEVSRAYETVALSEAQWRTQEKTADLAQEAFRQAKERYSLNLSTTLELRTADLRARTAQAAALNARWNHATAGADLARLVGGSLPEWSSFKE